MRTFFLWLVLLMLHGNSSAQSAPWIAYPTASVTDYGVFHFRKTVLLEHVPNQVVVEVSADNRYNLFVNGTRVAYGPAKGDLKTYKYDVVDITRYLTEGENQLAALVYNAGKDKPMAFLSAQTAFFLRSEVHGFNTDRTWKVFKNPAYRPISYQEMLFTERWFYGYYACGPGDDITASQYPWGWEELDFDDDQWSPAEELSFDGKPPWNLVPRTIAFMDDHLEKPAEIRLVEGLDIKTRTWDGSEKLTVPANYKAKILIDFELLTMGYPELTVTRGSGSIVQIKYAEALYEKVNLKAHRDSVNNLTMFGVWDVFRPDGPIRTFRPLWKRAFRYIQLIIETNDEPLDIVSLLNHYSGYPYPEMSTFVSNDPRLNQIFEMSLQTFRMCSGETYYDTPFYEQLSYGGDNRPIGNISTYNSTDDRLFKEVMRLYPQSENRETGLFKSAYPSRFDFDMGSWSLAWIQGLYDYYLTRGDKEFVGQFVESIEKVLGFYHRHLDENLGILGTVRNQNFMDWSISKGSIPRRNEDGEITHSTMLTLYYVHTLDLTSRLFKEVGEKERAEKWAAEAEMIRTAVKEHCWDEDKQLFSDTPGGNSYSQHANLLAILTDAVDTDQQKILFERVLNYSKFDEYASSYFSFFLFKAMQKVGREDLFLSNLGFWHNYIDRGHTTVGETGFASHDRSDCHAWSAHPAYFLLNLVCGIQSAGVGFQSILITPNLGSLTQVKASMPHPKGRIEVDYQVKKGKLGGSIVLPPGLKGEWVYLGEGQPLVPGMNKIK